jgi:hypothetical protein
VIQHVPGDDGELIGSTDPALGDGADTGVDAFGDGGAELLEPANGGQCSTDPRHSRAVRT